MEVSGERANNATASVSRIVIVSNLDKRYPFEQRDMNHVSII